MNKAIIELGRVSNFPSGCGRFTYPTAEDSEVLDRLIEWSKANPAVKIYKHKVRCVEENVGEPLSYKDDPKSWSSGQTPRTATCDKVDYLDIYYQ